jgi:single stranded DNA-binding protein
MNSVNLIGRACAAPSLKYVGQTNRPLADFTLAYDDPHNKDAAGNKRAYFFLIQIWGTKAELAAQHITKGQRIGVTGRLVQENFTPTGSDVPVTKTRIVADNFDLMDRPQPKPSAQSPAITPPEDGEEIPY